MKQEKTNSTPKMRLSLTKRQQQSAAGVELLALCQTVTEDGRLSKEDIVALRDWLRTHRESDMPSIGFLIETVEKIIADGWVSKEERRELYEAIKKILPPEARHKATHARRKVESARREQDRKVREAERRQEREKRKINRPPCSADFMVAGVRYEGRVDVIEQYLHEGDSVMLLRDPHNKYSKNAIEVCLTNVEQIGYVPEDYAVELAPYLDQNCKCKAYCKKILSGGHFPIPVIVACVYRPEACVTDNVCEQ